jgi:hypothetical protein
MQEQSSKKHTSITTARHKVNVIDAIKTSGHFNPLKLKWPELSLEPALGFVHNLNTEPDTG